MYSPSDCPQLAPTMYAPDKESFGANPENDYLPAEPFERLWQLWCVLPPKARLMWPNGFEGWVNEFRDCEIIKSGR